MATRRTWVWVLVGAAGVGLVALMVLAGSGIYFVTHHIRSEETSAPDALQAFDDVLESMHHPPPLYELDAADEPHLVRPLTSLPTASRQPDTLMLLAWDPGQHRIVRVSLPFWLLRLGDRKMRLVHGDAAFSLERLHLDVDELARIGPALVFDFRNQDGVRVLLWTQ
jgi:hypothetical protein